MISSAVLSRYSKSLAEVVFEENIEAKATSDLNMFNEIFRAVPALLDAFDSPAVPRDAKEKLLRELAARYPVHPISFNFLRILLQHNRLSFFSQIQDSYLKFVNEKKGIVSARVTSAAPLSARELTRLSSRLTELTGKQVDLETKTDAGLLGGVVVQMGSQIFDGSIRTQLAEMKRRLIET